MAMNKAMCWTYVPICVCGLVHVQEPLPIGLSQVVVWVHHGEWGLSSNTGKLLEVSMLNTTLLMKADGGKLSNWNSVSSFMRAKYPARWIV